MANKRMKILQMGYFINKDMHDFYQIAKLNNYSQMLLLLRIIWKLIKALLHVFE